MKLALLFPLLLIFMPLAYSEVLLKEDLWIMTAPEGLNFGYEAASTWVGGQFQASNTYYVDKLRFEMKNIYEISQPTGFFWVILYSDSGNAPSVALAYSELVPAHSFGEQGGALTNYTVNFNSTNRYQVQSGTKYWVTYKDINTNMVDKFQYSIARDNTGSYPTGNSGNWAIYTNDEPVFQIWENESINIVPYADIISMTSDNTTVNLANYTVSEYSSSNFTFNIIYSDSDGAVVSYNITITNSTGGLKKFSANKTMVISGENFANFLTESPYIITAAVRDDSGGVNSTIKYFNFTDPQIPTSSGFEGTSIIIGKTYTWNANLYDEYLWNFSILCSNGLNYSVSGLGLQSFHFANSTLINATTVCSIDFCDGHTGSSIGDMPISKTTNNILTFDSKELNFINAKSFSFEKKRDRYSFCVQMGSQNSRIEINMPKECVKAPNSPYMGHYVCGAYAVDLENDYGLKVDTLGNTAYIDISTLKAADSGRELCFNSIVSLNCVSLLQTITAIQPPLLYGNTIIENTNWFTPDLNTSTTKGIMLWFFLIFALIALVVYSEFSRIPALFILTALYGICVSFALFASVSAILGGVLCVISVLFILRGVQVSNT